MLYISAHSAVRIRLNEEFISRVAFVVVDVAAQSYAAVLEVWTQVIPLPSLCAWLVDS